MTAYRGLFLPTLVGVVALLPPASAYALPNQTSASAVSNLVLPTSGDEDELPQIQVHAVPESKPASPVTVEGMKERTKGEEISSLLFGHSPSQAKTLVSTEGEKTVEILASPQARVPVSEDKGEELGVKMSPHSLSDSVGISRQPSVSADAASSTAQVPTVASGGVRILYPQPGEISDRTTSLIIQYPAGQTLQVKVNGNLLDPETPTQIERDETQNLVTQTWYNIRLYDGENVITVQAGNDVPSELRLVVGNQATKLTVIPGSDPRVRADGRSTVTISGSITDKDGEPVRQPTLVTLSSSAGQFVGADQDEDLPGFQVIAREGQFTAQLQSSLQAQQVRVRAAIHKAKPSINDLKPEGRPALTTDEELPPGQIEAYTQVEFVPNLRPSLVSGVVNLRIGPGNTDYWGSFRDFLNPDSNDGYTVDVDAGLFATGPVGEWLFTGAFNSDRALNADCDGNNRIFGGLQFCERPYPVYGDSSSVDYMTPSKDSFYVRFERPARTPGAEPDYGMWGDYRTLEFNRPSQLFTANNRALHGFKANYSFGNLQVTTLFSPDVEGFKRDTIVPNGTSGFYYLSERLLVPGSENIFIELEESDRPGTVLERKQLSRGPDYEIDYDQGRILFRRPIFATEFDLGYTGTAGSGPVLVRRIVATYQYEGGRDTNVYAGRVQYNLNQSVNRPSFVGASYWREDRGIQNFDLLGLDFFVPLGRSGQLIGEYARSSNDFSRVSGTGSAYRLEANSAIASWLSGRAYFRSVDEDFLNNATTSFNPGQTRYGASLAANLTSTTVVDVQYDYERNFGRSVRRRDFLDELLDPGLEARRDERLDNSLRTISAGVRQRIGRADLSLSYVNRTGEDRQGDFDQDTNQVVARLNVPLLYRKEKPLDEDGLATAVSRTRRGSPLLTFRGLHEQNLRDSDRRYPTRTVLALDWAALPGVTMRLGHEFIEGSLFGKDSITRLDTIAEREIFKDTTISSRYSILSGYNGIGGEGAFGVQSRLRIAPGLRLLLGYERVTSSQFYRTGTGRRFRQPYAVGLSAASLGIGEGNSFSVGLDYTDNPDFQASGRFEYRNGDSGDDNMVITLGAAGKVSRSLTALLRYYQANAANQRLDRLGNSMNLRVGIAYRDPSDDKFNALLKYEFRNNPYENIDELLQDTDAGEKQHLFALEAIYAPMWRWEFYGKYAFRLNDDKYASNTISLAQLRTTYRLGYRTDVAGELRWIGQTLTDYNEWGWAAEFGYYLTPDLRLGLGYSFGSVDDPDFSGFRSSGGPYFQLTFKVNELFGGFGRQRVVPRQQQENEIRPVRANLPTSRLEAKRENEPHPLFLLVNALSAQKAEENVAQPEILELFYHSSPLTPVVSPIRISQTSNFTSNAAKFLSLSDVPEAESPSLWSHH